VLLSTFFSPGTALTVALIVTGCPVGGAVVSASSAEPDWPAVVSTVFVRLMGAPAPVIETWICTPFSSFSPEFV
jgi:hypothetical protein